MDTFLFEGSALEVSKTELDNAFYFLILQV